VTIISLEILDILTFFEEVITILYDLALKYDFSVCQKEVSIEKREMLCDKSLPKNKYMLLFLIKGVISVSNLTAKPVVPPFCTILMIKLLNTTVIMTVWNSSIITFKCLYTTLNWNTVRLCQSKKRESSNWWWKLNGLRIIEAMKPLLLYLPSRINLVHNKSMNKNRI